VEAKITLEQAEELRLIRAWPKSTTPWRLLRFFHADDHEHEEVTRGGLLLHAAHQPWHAGEG